MYILEIKDILKEIEALDLKNLLILKYCLEKEIEERLMGKD